ncbi:MAG TPA: thiamine pyrophosphate-binding protein [Bryobacteraceae bacterium]
MKLADYLFACIAEQGVKHIFLVVGGGAMHLNESLAREKRIEFVCNSHEQASAICAENYAKATDNLGCALVTTGPGGTNAVTGLAGAWLDSTPVLFISGQVKRADRMYRPDGTPLGVRQMGPQEIDIVSVVKPLTKYAVTVLDPNEIRYHIEKALHLARSGRPGPVWLDIPLDVQSAQIDPSTLAGFDPAELPAPPSADVRSFAAEVIERLNASERPLLMVGNGVRLAHAVAEMNELRRLAELPTAVTWVASDLVSSNDPLFAGRPGSLAARGANFAIQNCDFLLMIGTRMDNSLTGFAPRNLARAAWKAMVDVDPAELAKLDGALGNKIVADAGAFLRELLAQKKKIEPKDRLTWRERVACWQQRYPLITGEHRKPGSQVSIYHLSEVLSQELTPEDCIVSGSSGSGIEIFIFSYPSRAGQRVYHTAGLGAMGFGLPASIGVSLAKGRRRTICVDGDGGFQFNIQELETVARLNLPLKFFILNNDGYASIRSSQKGWFGKSTIGAHATTGLTVPDLSKIAASYGITSYVIEDQRNLSGDVRKVLDMPGPVVVDVHVIPEEIRGPRVTSVQLPDGRFVSKPMEDLWPFLPRDEFRENMIVPPLED